MSANASIVYEGFSRDSINYVGLGVVIGFYLLILIIGLIASWRSKSFSKEANTEDIMLAGRSLGASIGVFSLTATWVGGGYINGTAENVYTPGFGLVWTQAPWGFALGLILGGLFYAKPMREARYVTMLDPFEQRYGSVIAALCYIPALLGDIFWSGAILSALGGTLTVIIGLRHEYSVIISAAIAIFYTLLGGLYSVAFTDVIQLICIAVGLVVTIPFALQHAAVGNIWDHAVGADGWLGAFPTDAWAGNWLDGALLLVMGGVPWQVYFQRVLAFKTSNHAQWISFVAAVGSILLAIPAIFIGAIAKATDWNATEYRVDGQIPMPREDYKLILPLVMQYLTPTAVAVVGLGAVSAAVMSSTDSAVLSCSCMFSRNVYKPFRKAVTQSAASEKELLWVMRIGIVLAGAAASAMAILVNSIYGLFYLCGDLVYVILFPQLTCAVHLSFANSYGALTGWILGMFFRLSGGEPLLSIPPLILYPNYDDETGTQLTPFKTLSMLICLITIIAVSGITHFCFKRNILPIAADVFHCYHEANPVKRGKKKYMYEMNPYESGAEGSYNPTYEPENT